MAGLDTPGSERGQLRIEVLTQSAHRELKSRCHSTTVSLPSDIDDLRHAARDKK